LGVAAGSTQARLVFSADLEEKILFYQTGGGNDFGVTMAAGVLQIHAGESGGRLGLGYDVGGSFTETLSIGGGNVYAANAAGLNYFAGFLGVGTASPSASAYLLLGAATTGVSSLRITAGTAPSSPVDGDVWHDSTRKCHTTFTAGISQYVPGVIFVQTASATVSNTTSETSIFGTGIGTRTLPANFWTVGKTIEIDIWGHQNADATPANQVVRLKLGTVVVAASAAEGDMLDTNALWHGKFIITCRSTGATGSVIGQGFVNHTEADESVESWDLVATATATINTTAAMVVDVTFQPDAPETATAWTSTNAVIKVRA
jgi:hypothetical protein